MTEQVNCALCGNDNAELLFVGRDRMHGIPGAFNVVRCRACSLIYINPRPVWSEMLKFYPIDYAGHGFRTTSRIRGLIRRGGWLKKLQLVRRHKWGGALLDVGCGKGDFLQIVSRDKNWKVFGVEPDAEAARYATQVTGAEVFCSRLEETVYPPCSFDVVTMWHVLEHLYDPKDALDRLRRALKPDGLLVLAVPVVDSVDARLFGPHWVGYDVPRHLFTFSKATLSEMFTASGFSSVHFEAFIGGHDAFCISLAYWVEEYLKSPTLSRLVRATSQSVVARLLMMPYYMITAILGRGSTVVATARPVK